MVLRYDRNCEKEANKVLILLKILRKSRTIVSNYSGICLLRDHSHSLQIIIKKIFCGRPICALKVF